MKEEKKDFKTILYGVIMPKVYGIGAAVVILGAMFKILNWPGANFMIGAGLTTEAVIFFLSAFEPSPKEYHWELVYPELNEDGEGLQTATPKQKTKEIGIQGTTKEFDDQMAHLTKTLQNLNSVYSEEATQVSERIGYNEELYNNAAKAMEEMHKASVEAEEFKIELERLREKISSLNEIYEKTLSALKS